LNSEKSTTLKYLFKIEKNSKINGSRFVETSQLNEQEKEQSKLKFFKIKQCRKLLLEIVMNFVFMGVLFTFVFSTMNTNSLFYSSQTQSSFSGYQDVKSVEDLYGWLSSDFLSTLLADQSEYDSSIRSTYANFDYFLNDAASFVVGYPILRQLRTRKSNLNYRLYSKKSPWANF
jgi:hypothetical protein